MYESVGSDMPQLYGVTGETLTEAYRQSIAIDMHAAGLRLRAYDYLHVICARIPVHLIYGMFLDFMRATIAIGYYVR